MAGLQPIVTQLTRNSTNRRPRYRTVTPVHPRTAAAPSRSLPAQHRFRIPATPLLLSFPSLPFSSPSFTSTFPTPCYFPLRVIIPWDLLYQIPNPPTYCAHPLFFPSPSNHHHYSFTFQSHARRAVLFHQFNLSEPPTSVRS